MNEEDRERIIRRYSDRIDAFGVGIDALASGNRDRQTLRFKVLSEVGIQPGDSVLDVGCGFADLYPYLKNHLGDIRYTGVDINPAMIESASTLYPEIDLMAVDLQDVRLPSFDWVVSTSSFNLKLGSENNYTFVNSMISRMFESATKGVAVDFLTSYVDFKGNPEEAFYYEPERLFSFAKSLSKRVTLRHDYPLYDFCLYLYPDFDRWA